ADYVYDVLKGESILEKPLYITNVRIQQHKLVSFSSSLGAHWVTYLSEDILIDAINKKESKHEVYLQNTKLHKQWLLIVIDNASADSYEFSDYPFAIEVDSKFEKIFLMEDFAAK